MGIAAALIALLAPAPAQAQEDERERVPVTVVVIGDDAPAAAARRALEGRHGLPVELRIAEPPPGRPAPTPVEAAGAVEAALATARQAYVDAEFERCLTEAGGAERPAALLGEGRRVLAARVLFWRIACLAAAGDAAGAGREAERFGVLGLELPAEAGAATPDVERMIAGTVRRATEAPRLTLRVVAEGGPARVAVDGRPDCRAPCAADLPAGDHVVRVEADGFVPDVRTVRVDASRTVRVRLEPAPPELAAAQWAAGFDHDAPGVDSRRSVLLLGRALRARRLLLVVAETEGRGTRLRGVLAADGRVVARAEDRAERDTGEAAIDLARELLLQARVLLPPPPLARRPLFWIGIGAAAAIAAGVTAFLLYDPPDRTVVSF